MERVESTKIDGTNTPFFLSFNIFHGHSSTELLAHKKILVVWKPITFCNGFLLDSTLENEFTQALLISGMISVGSCSM